MLGAVGPAIGDTRIPGRRARTRTAAATALRARPLHQLPTVPRASPGRSPRGASSPSCARTPRAPTPARVASFDAARRTRSRPRVRSTRASASNAACVTPSSAPRRSSRPDSRWCTRPTCSTFAGDLWSRVVAEVAAEYPDGRGRLQPRRRRVHLPGREPAALRRHRDRQSLRRHPLGPGRRGHRRHRLRGERQPEPGAHRRVALRTGPRRRARHRGHRDGQSLGRRLLGRADARTPR